MMEHYLASATRNVRRRKMRSWLTMIGIVMSIATIFLLISISLGLNAAVQEQFRQLGADKFFIQPKGQLGDASTDSAAHLGPDDLVAIRRVAGVQDYSYWSIKGARIEFRDQIRFVNVIGMPLQHSSVFFESGFVKPEQGVVLRSGDSRKVMIGSQYLHNNVFSDPVKAGNTIKIQDQNFKVGAVLKTIGNPADDKSIYMPLEDFEDIFPNQTDIYSQIAVQIQPGQDITAIAERVEKQLIRSRGVTEKTKDFTILTPEQLLATFGTVLNILTGFLLGVAAISLLVGGIGITNTMYTAVLERTKEIGVMKAVGATNFDILALFTAESGLLGLLGGVGGVVIGYIVGMGVEFVAANMAGLTILQVSTPWYLIVGSLLFSFAIGAIAGLVPAYRASRVRPVVALRYE